MRLATVALSVAAMVSMAELVPEDHPLFQDGTVQVISLYFYQEDFWEVLEENYADETYLEAGFQWGEFSFENVGVRFKGGSSYTFNPTMKKSFKIDFDVFVEDQSIEGINKINLNCNYDDPSFVREAAAYEICRAAGIPCPRTSFAALYINDTYWGLYTIVEQFDKHFIEERFGESEDGNLWKGDNHGTLEFLGWNQESYYGEYELKTNESVNDWTDLLELADKLNNTPEDCLEDSLSEVMDVNTALLLLAVDNLLVNLDSYAGRGANYYLYHMDRDGRFVFGEWDMNESWGCFNSWGYSIGELQQLDIHWTNPDPAEERPLASVLWGVDTWEEVYRGHLLRMMAREARPETLIADMEEMRDLIRDWVYMEVPPRRLFSPEQFEQAMDSDVPIGPGRYAPALGTFIQSRHEYLVSVLGEWEPEENIILNELMAGNDSTVADGYGEYDDWVEIVNRGSQPADLSSLALTDDMAYPGRFTFPDTVLQPGDYLLLWADGETEQGGLHAEFKLDGDGEELYLLQGGVIVDQITFPKLDDDDSWGRFPDLDESWSLQAYPTPGAPNTDQPPEEGWEPGAALAILCPNPILPSAFEARITGISGLAELSLFDISGRLISTPYKGDLNGECTVGIDTSGLPCGVYVLRLRQGGNAASRVITLLY